jgi:hypothetical protein
VPMWLLEEGARTRQVCDISLSVASPSEEDSECCVRGADV